MRTGIHRQNHIRMVFFSKETFPNEVLHLRDRRTTLEVSGQGTKPRKRPNPSHSPSNVQGNAEAA